MTGIACRGVNHRTPHWLALAAIADLATGRGCDVSGLGGVNRKKRLYGRLYFFARTFILFSMDETQLLVLSEIAANGRGATSRIAKRLGITLQAASGRLRRLKNAGLIDSEGKGAGVRYRLRDLQKASTSYDLEGLEEDRVWRELVKPVVADLPDNVQHIWHHGTTEMVNNAIDHSGGRTVYVEVHRNALFTDCAIADDGEGIFLKIQRALGLYDPREAILELAKGKLTTDPEKHTGEGIFFSSRAFTQYDIASGHLHFMHDAGLNDLLVERRGDASGTIVLMRLDNRAPTALRAIFDKFAVPEEFTFAKTVVPVRLAQHEGEGLVSRSQAKRLTMRFEKFKTVILDFSDVEQIGQAFADEVFRVFQNAHPDTKLVPTGMNPYVKAMVSRVKSAR